MICYMPVVIGAKYAVRISNLEDDMGLQFNCLWCGHVSIMPATYFKAKFPAYKRIVDIEHQFRCGKCRNKLENGWKVVRQVRQDTPTGSAGQVEDLAEDLDTQKTHSRS